MTSERTAETEALYTQGIELFRAAQWSEAVRVFSELRAISSAYPEIDALIADALLKIEVERTKMPEVAPPPRRLPAWVIGAVALVLLLAGGGALIAMRPTPPPEPVPTPRPTIAAALPTPAPTSTPKPAPQTKTVDVTVNKHADSCLTPECGEVAFNFVYTAPLGWHIDHSQGDSGHPGLSEIENNSNRQANDSLRNYNYGAQSDNQATVSGTIRGAGFKGPGAIFERKYRVYLVEVIP